MRLAQSNDSYVTSTSVDHKVDLRARIQALLSSMDPQLRDAIMSLAKADANTRRTFLESMPADARANLETILKNL